MNSLMNLILFHPIYKFMYNFFESSSFLIQIYLFLNKINQWKWTNLNVGLDQWSSKDILNKPFFFCQVLFFFFLRYII